MVHFYMHDCVNENTLSFEQHFSTIIYLMRKEGLNFLLPWISPCPKVKGIKIVIILFTRVA